MASYASVPAPTRPYWRAQLLGWLLYTIFSGIVFAIFGSFSLDMLLITVLISATLLGLTHGLRYHIRARGWERLPPLPLLGRLLLANAVLAVLGQGIIWVVIMWVVRPAPTGQPYGWAQFVGYVLNINFVFWLWTGFYFGWHYLRSYRQAEIDKWQLAAAAREAELRTLQAQLNPHFLFNGLNNIRALVMEDPARARLMMTHLAELLRYSMQRNGTEQVPLATELEIVENYLQLEAMQLEERLHYTLAVAPEALPSLLPPMTLQLLVENAIKHGLAPRPAGGNLSLSVQLDAAGAGLLIAVRNTGTYQPQPGHPGVGVRNVRERLTLLFGSAAHFAIGPDPLLPDTVLAELSLPVASTQLASHERLTH